MMKVRFRLAILIFVAVFSLPALASSGRSSSQSPKGASDFNANCAMCHGPDGTGTATGKSLNAPNLRSATVQKQSSATLERFITEGKDSMPSFKSQLTAEQIKAEVAYVRWLAHHKVSE